MKFSDWLESEECGAHVCRMLLERYPQLRFEMEKAYAVTDIRLSTDQLKLQLEAGHA